MGRSLKEGFVELLVASLRPALERRDLQGSVNDVKTSFSSWDNCMQATYCKWPVIAVIIVGGLIVLSVAWCIGRCLCCGLSCCCECCQCLKCCGNCCGCCDPPRGKHKYLDEPYIPPHQGYKAQPPMNPGFSNPAFSSPAFAMTPAVAAPAMTPASTGVTTGPPQYAEFDVSKKGEAAHEDALPAMPSWEGAGKKKVLVEEEEVEMDQLKKPEASGQDPDLLNGAAAAIPGQVSPMNSPGNNRSPYGPPPGGNPGSNGYFPASTLEADPYAQQPGQVYPPVAGGYGRNSPAAAMGMVAGAMPPQRSPRGYGDTGYSDTGYGQGQGRGFTAPALQGSFDTYGAGRQASYDNYGAQGNNNGYGMGAHRSPPNELADNNYGMGARRSPPNELADNSYSQNSGYGQQEPVRRSPAPQAGAYGGYDNSGYDDRGFSTESARPLRAPQRQYTRDAMPAPTPVSHPPVDIGFDFSSGYSRPNVGYRQPSPPQAQQPAAYPGYKPYSPSGSQQQQGGW
ncbi:hypothetical protein B0H67DRAFT_597475 [Lasiosphaeris hirsuta]|uniref:Fibroin-3 related protein n=1 Tax=Lasiosphaeris hirsuta TaxID=260670 RepID=A0AA40BCC0_9PEZI|nr:hypothetical protein B0H67DRAFT_597475 [Lasiosphaeris hirsuta]